VVDGDAMVHVAVEVYLQRQIFGVTGFEATAPDLIEMIPEPGATLRPRKPLTANAPPAALNPCLAKPIANARLTQ
jgi:hypothetical protein